jgi:hypothetical protein
VQAGYVYLGEAGTQLPLFEYAHRSASPGETVAVGLRRIDAFMGFAGNADNMRTLVSLPTHTDRGTRRAGEAQCRNFRSERRCSYIKHTLNK